MKFLKKTIKGRSLPTQKSKNKPSRIEKDRKQGILKTLGTLFLADRIEFWNILAINN
jgi:hypothetical protein